MAGRTLFWFSFICIASATLCMFIAFSTPYWIKSWTRVHSPMSNVGLWHVCLAGYIKPRDPELHSYVGCWWIHSTLFKEVSFNLMPHWFKLVQTFTIFTLICDVITFALMMMYLSEYTKDPVFKNRKVKMFAIICGLNAAGAFFVFIDSLVFAQMSIDPEWMPRPWMNYLSFSYGLNVLSGFFNAFACMFTFLLVDVIRTKPPNPDVKDTGDTFI